MRNLVGLTIGLTGCVLYSHLKLAESSQQLDLFDRCCPSVIHSALLLQKRIEAATADDEEASKPLVPQGIPAAPMHTDATIALRRVSEETEPPEKRTN